MRETHSVEQLVDVSHLTAIEFEEVWGEPTTSEHTDLDTVPEEATIDFGNGVVRDSGARLIIKKAMLDPEATVYPDDG